MQPGLRRLSLRRRGQSFTDTSNHSALSVLGVAGNAAAPMADIVAGANRQFLYRASNALAFAAPFPDITTNHIAFGTGTGDLQSSQTLQYDPIASQLKVEAAVSGSTLTGMLVNNSSPTALSGARIKASISAGATGDVMYTVFASGLATGWTWGLDYSESGRFALNPSDGTLGTGDLLQITTAGATTLAGATFDQVLSSSGATVNQRVRNTSNTASSAAQQLVEVAGASAGDAMLQWSVAGVQQWVCGIDNDAGDRWTLCLGTALGTSDVLTIDTSGFVGINVAPDANYRLKVGGGGLTLISAITTGGTVRSGFSAISGGGTQLDHHAYGSTHGGTIFGENKAGICTLEAYPAASNGFLLGVDGANPLFFNTNSVRRMTIDGGGGVGVGAVAAASHRFYIEVGTEIFAGMKQTDAALYARWRTESNNNTLTIYTFGGSYGASPFFSTVATTGSQIIGDGLYLILGTTTAAPLKFGTNNTIKLELTSAGVLTFSDAVNIAFNATTGTKIGTATTQKLAFYNATPVVQPTRGATLTNNVTAGGTDDTIANYTDLTTYATDAAAIRNNIYQLARAVRMHDVALRALGLES